MAHLTQEQRYTISRLLANNKKQCEIATIIGKNKSVVSREIKRNKDQRNGVYRHELANKKYKLRHKLKPKRKRFTEEVKAHVDVLLKKDYSPEQITGVCVDEGIDCVSHERIYQYVWQNKKEDGDLYTHLRRKGRRYRKRGNKKDSRGIIKTE